MKYIDEFNDPELARRLLDDIHAAVTRPWRLMEVCGGQIHSIIRHGSDQLLPAAIEMIHGPGCPVCVTPLELIDKAMAIASRPGVTFCSFGDMLRVPGSGSDQFRVKSQGGDVRVVYSPLDALRVVDVGGAVVVGVDLLGFAEPPFRWPDQSSRRPYPPLPGAGGSSAPSTVRVPAAGWGAPRSAGARTGRGSHCVLADEDHCHWIAGSTGPGSGRAIRLDSAPVRNWVRSRKWAAPITDPYASRGRRPVAGVAGPEAPVSTRHRRRRRPR